MADEHFFPGHGEFFPGPGDFSSGIGAAAFFGSSYAPPGLDAHAAMQLGFGTVAWAADDDLQLPADSSAAHFDSALSSLVSSPAHNAGGDDVAAIGDLIGRLGSICNAPGSASNSCYSTPLSSPPRGASSAFRGCYHGGAAAFDAAGGTGGRLSRVASSKSLGAAAPRPPVLGSPGVETSPKIMGSSAETPDPLIMLPAAVAAKGNGGAARKRKASAKAGRTSSSAMAAAAANASPKRSKGAAGGGGDGTSKDDEDTDAAAEDEKPKPEPAKGYIHVRARRGQATDSHSLAERVRRERISERMKMLQSLVPGCNKITGKALMLDEIINYVQSLQRQVEFLSMKLATMNPGAVAVELDTHYQQQLPAATLAYPASAAAGLSSAYAAGPLFAAAQTAQLDSWEAQDLQSILNHSSAAVHGHHDLYASPSPPAPPQPLYHHTTVVSTASSGTCQTWPAACAGERR